MFILRSFLVVALTTLISLRVGNATPTNGTLTPLLVANSSLSLREIDVRSSIPSLVVGTPVTYLVASNGSIINQAIGKVGVNELQLEVLAPEASDAVAIAAISGLGGIAAAVCQKGSPQACAIVGFTAVIGIFFTLFQLSGREEESTAYFSAMLEYPAIPGCGVACRLHLEAPEGDWRSIGNATVNGTFHDIHFKKVNGLHGLRAIQSSSSSSSNITERSEDNDGGMVFDYHWTTDSETAYDSFDSTQSQINSFGELASEVVFEENTLLACCDFGDSNGEVNGGLLSVGWNNEAYQFDEGEETSILSRCNTNGQSLT